MFAKIGGGPLKAKASKQTTRTVMASSAGALKFDPHPNSKLIPQDAAEEGVQSIRRHAVENMLNLEGWQDGNAMLDTDHCKFHTPVRQTVYAEGGESVPVICGSLHEKSCKTGMETFWAAHNGTECIIMAAFGDFYVPDSHQVLRVIDPDTIFVNMVFKMDDFKFNFPYVAARWWQEDRGFILMRSCEPDDIQELKYPDLPRVMGHCGTVYLPDPDEPEKRHHHTCYCHWVQPVPVEATAKFLDYVHMGMQACMLGIKHPYSDNQWITAEQARASAPQAQAPAQQDPAQVAG